MPTHLIQRMKHERIAPRRNGPEYRAVGNSERHLEHVRVVAEDEDDQQAHQVHRVAEVQHEVVVLQPVVQDVPYYHWSGTGVRITGAAATCCRGIISFTH